MNRPRKANETFAQYRANQKREALELKEKLKGDLIMKTFRASKTHNKKQHGHLKRNM